MTVDLDDCPEFEALSYAWDSSSRSSALDCESNHCSLLATLKVTSSVRDALEHLRLQGASRLVWIDALCINQQCAEELTTQILLFPEIYHKAKKTILWLGPADSDTQDTFNILEDLLADYKLGFYWDIDSCFGEFLHKWSAFERLFKKAWFWRTWIVPEVIVSRDPVITCGQYSISWERFHHAIAIVKGFKMKMMGRTNHPVIERILSIAASQITGHKRSRPTKDVFKGFVEAVTHAPRSLDYLLLLVRSGQVTKPQDKVFSVLPLVSEYGRGNLKPDYTVSLTQLFINVAAVIAKQPFTSVLKFLSYVQHDANIEADHSEELEKLPSWVPDWRQPLYTQRLMYDLPFRVGMPEAEVLERYLFVGFPDSVPEPRKIGADTNVLRPYSNAISERRLMIHGVKVLKVFKATLISKQTLLNLAEIFNTFDDPYPTTKCTYAEVSQHLVHPDRQMSLSPTGSTSNAWNFIHKTRRVLRQRKPLPLHLKHSSSTLNMDAWALAENEVNLAQGRSLLLSEEGFIGLGPPSSQIGDRICLLFGGNALYVLRKRDANWEYIGECCFYGLMGLELHQGFEDFEVENFVLV